MNIIIEEGGLPLMWGTIGGSILLFCILLYIYSMKEENENLIILINSSCISFLLALIIFNLTFNLGSCLCPKNDIECSACEIRNHFNMGFLNITMPIMLVLIIMIIFTWILTKKYKISSK
jgi:chromate transport protein ChrA